MESTTYNLIGQQELAHAMRRDNDETALFILNNADLPDESGVSTRDSGTLVFTAMVDGRSRIVRVPVSWVPVDVSMQAPKMAVLNSAEFQKALAARVLVILTRDQANRIIKADAASELEYNRVMSIASGVTPQATTSVGNQSGDSQDPWANVSASVKLQIEQVKMDIIDLMEMRSWLRRHSRSITSLDREYIRAELPDLANG